MNNLPEHRISFEDGTYVFEYKDMYWSVVTDGSTIELLWKNINEAMELHFEWVEAIEKKDAKDVWYTPREFVMPLTLSFSNRSYAFDVQKN